MKVCPYCHKGLPIYKIRNTFTCPHCNASLGSNTAASVIMVFMLGEIITYPLSYILLRGGPGTYELSFAADICLFILIWPFTLKVTRSAPPPNLT